MHKLFAISLLVLVSLTATPAAAAEWVEGKHYFPITPAQPTFVAPDKVEVIEVFSYACPACDEFYPTAEKLRAALPGNVEMRYIPASWIAAESWPLFQRAYLTASALGVAEQAHGAMFKAIWASDELAVVDRRTNRIKSPAPTLEQVAAFYERTTGVKQDEFLKAAKSFSVEAGMKRADATIKNYRVDSTPSLVINGRYRFTVRSAGGYDQAIELASWLVAKETD